jgi:hypothetical protein
MSLFWALIAVWGASKGSGGGNSGFSFPISLIYMGY